LKEVCIVYKRLNNNYKQKKLYVIDKLIRSRGSLHHVRFVLLHDCTFTLKLTLIQRSYKIISHIIIHRRTRIEWISGLYATMTISSYAHAVLTDGDDEPWHWCGATIKYARIRNRLVYDTCNFCGQPLLSHRYDSSHAQYSRITITMNKKLRFIVAIKAFITRRYNKAGFASLYVWQYVVMRKIFRTNCNYNFNNL